MFVWAHVCETAVVELDWINCSEFSHGWTPIPCALVRNGCAMRVAETGEKTLDFEEGCAMRVRSVQIKILSGVDGGAQWLRNANIQFKNFRGARWSPVCTVHKD